MIRAEELFKDFNTQKGVLNNLNFSVEEKEIVAFVGANGSGKTTLLKILSTLLLPTSGSIYIDGKSSYKKIKKVVGFLSSDPVGMFGQLTGHENINYFSAFYKNSVDKKLDQWKELPAFKQALKTPFNQCSTGMKFSLLLFKTLLHHPKVLILDEPFTSLDQVSRVFVIDQLRQFNTDGTVVLASHQLDQLDDLSPRKIQLMGGRIV